MSSKVTSWANKYVMLEKIGGGTYGTVYKVRDIHKDQKDKNSIKALKEIGFAGKDRDQIEECAIEGRILANLNHEFILKYFDSFSYNEYYCMVTEFCEGGDMNQYIVKTKTEGKHIPEKQVVRWFIQLLQALNYIHQKHILHRDLKTGNIFLNDNSIKLGDFGICRILNNTLDLATSFIGTVFYMSPEVLKHDGYNTRSDIWSSGVVLYEMCALKHPFDGKGIMNIMEKIVDKPCPIIPEEYYSPQLQDIVTRILSKESCNRPTAADLLQLDYLKKCIKDPWSDTAADLETTYLADRKRETSAKSWKKENDDTLTPKQKFELRKKKEADLKAEKLKQVGSEIYRTNAEQRKNSKMRLNKTHVPVMNREMNASVNSPKRSGSMTVIPLVQEEDKSPNMFTNVKAPLNQTFNFSDYFKGQDNYEVPPLLNNQEMYEAINVKSRQLICIENEDNCQVKVYDSDEPNNSDYPDDFEESNSESDCKPDSDTINESEPCHFQDDEESDPFGKNAKIRKINNMKKIILNRISEDKFNEAMRVLKSNQSQDKVYKSLLKLFDDKNIAFMIEQICFLEAV